jgi:hypothetical protein
MESNTATSSTSKLLTRFVGILLIGLMSVTSMGCSIGINLTQPARKNLSVFEPGTPREHIVAEIGEPAWSGARNDQRKEIFAFKPGRYALDKAGRTFVYLVWDLGTLGIAEIFTTPAEVATRSRVRQMEVTYDPAMRVVSSEWVH